MPHRYVPWYAKCAPGLPTTLAASARRTFDTLFKVCVGHDTLSPTPAPTPVPSCTNRNVSGVRLNGNDSIACLPALEVYCEVGLYDGIVMKNCPKLCGLCKYTAAEIDAMISEQEKKNRKLRVAGRAPSAKGSHSNELARVAFNRRQSAKDNNGQWQAARRPKRSLSEAAAAAAAPTQEAEGQEKADNEMSEAIKTAGNLMNRFVRVTPCRGDSGS